MEKEFIIDLSLPLKILKKKLWFILLITFICTAVAGLLSYFVLTPVYEASTSIIIGSAPNEHDPNDQYSSRSEDIYMYQKLITTYASIANSDLVADRTAELLGSGMTGTDIHKTTTVTPETDTQILDIKCQSKDSAVAQKMVNTLAVTFIEESQKIYPTDNIKIMDVAKLPKVPVKPRKVLNMTVAFLLGMMGSIGIVFIVEHMDNTVKTEDDVAKLLKLPVLGVIPQKMERT
jgi:capsular polysaccharide biosynthesis protein